MDSVTQWALGAAVCVAVMGRRTAVWKAVWWGGVAGTLPDLDVLIDTGDPVSQMTSHRGFSHALFYLTLASPLLAGLVTRVHRDQAPQWRRWWLALCLALLTHPLLDAMTVYGTRLALPFSDHPFGLGSVFIIDPLYTAPLLMGVLMTWVRPNSQRWNHAGLWLSTAYLGWSVVAQQQVLTQARASLAAQGVEVQQLMATPAPFTTVLWRIVALTPEAYLEGFHSLLDPPGAVHFDRFERGLSLYEALQDQAPVRQLAAFSKGYFKMQVQEGQVLMSDLRMGQEPHYAFTFRVARLSDGLEPLSRPESAGSRPEASAALAWWWRRLLGEPLPPPR
jgi:inner membrane protein